MKQLRICQKLVYVHLRKKQYDSSHLALNRWNRQIRDKMNILLSIYVKNGRKGHGLAPEHGCLASFYDVKIPFRKLRGKPASSAWLRPDLHWLGFINTKVDSCCKTISLIAEIDLHQRSIGACSHIPFLLLWVISQTHPWLCMKALSPSFVRTVYNHCSHCIVS